MHGVGTNLDITSDRTQPIVLDVTRLVSRVGRGPFTGVDRVELAYLEWCLATDAPLHGLARLADGYALLDRAGLTSFRNRLIGNDPWGRRDLRALVGFKTAAVRGRVEADLRRLAIARSGKSKLPTLPNGIYLNVGHANLSATTLGEVVAQSVPVAVLIHDMIPLDFPQYQRPGTSQAFEQKMRLVADHASLVIANSKDTESRVRAYFDTWKAEPAYVSAHLGVPKVSPSQEGKNRPYFCVIGTIEPRKNHALLLDAWEDMPADERPELYVIGQRGWNNEAVFSRLDALANMPWLHEHNDMDDAALTSLLAGSNGLLFPSFAEGFGLPSLEAAQLGIPVICGDLAIHRELLGDYPIYLALDDHYAWKKTIIEQARQGRKDLVRARKSETVSIPTWSEHFDAVNAALSTLG